MSAIFRFFLTIFSCVSRVWVSILRIEKWSRKPGKSDETNELYENAFYMKFTLAWRFSVVCAPLNYFRWIYLVWLPSFLMAHIKIFTWRSRRTSHSTIYILSSQRTYLRKSKLCETKCRTETLMHCIINELL